MRRHHRHRRLPDECAVQQPTRRTEPVPAPKLRRRARTGLLRPLHRPGVPRGPRAHREESSRHPPHQLRDARVGHDALRRNRQGGPTACRRTAVPSPRRIAHLPRSPRGRCRDARPPSPRALQRRPALRRHFGDHGHGRLVRRTQCRRGRHSEPPVRYPSTPGKRHQRKPRARNRRRDLHRRGESAARDQQGRPGCPHSRRPRVTPGRRLGRADAWP